MEMVEGVCKSCGRKHHCGVKEVLVEAGALRKLPALLDEAGAKKPFLVMDENTKTAAGNEVMDILCSAHIPFVTYCFPTREIINPTEESVGKVMMSYDPSCDCALAIGSGVINDITKFISRVSGKPYILTLTAPSMDGILSPTSSMDSNGVKVSLPSALAWGAVADLDVLCDAPKHMLAAGAGDMIAKYISICEWRISNLITGEYYCPDIAAMMEKAARSVTSCSSELMSGDKKAIKEVTEGLILAGSAMAYAGCTRPASGMEHYISHLMDMRKLSLGKATDLHGIQVGTGTLVAMKLYDEVRKIPSIDTAGAKAYAQSFDYGAWADRLRSLLGSSAEILIATEKKEGKYDAARQAVRVERIAAVWPQILSIINESLPDTQTIQTMLRELGIPQTLEDYDIRKEDIPDLIKATKDIRDKYVGTRLLWDIGKLDEVVGKL